MKQPFYLLLFILIAGCDSASEDADVKSTRTIHLVANENKSTVIDLQKIFKSYKSVDWSAHTGVDYFSDRYFKYSAVPGAANEFSFAVNETDNTKALVNVKTSTLSQLTCQDNPAFTYAKISNKEVLVVNLLNNPEFCGYDIYDHTEMGVSGPRPGIDVDQNSEGVLIELCACGPKGNHAIFTYVPPSGFTGQVKYKYYLQANADYDTYGEAIYYDPQYSEYFTAHEVIIDVTN